MKMLELDETVPVNSNYLSTHTTQGCSGRISGHQNRKAAVVPVAAQRVLGRESIVWCVSGTPPSMPMGTVFKTASRNDFHL